MFDIIILEIVNKFMIIIYFFLAQKAQQDGYITSAPGYVQINSNQYTFVYKVQQDGYITSASGYVQIITQINIF